MGTAKKVAVNTIALYGRSVLSAGLSLFSSRWVLSALGASDYGLFNIVGSTIVFIAFLNGIMAGSVSRQLAFSEGRGNSDEVNYWFNTALSIHILLSVFSVAFGLPVGEYCVRKVFTIPSDRIEQCVWVFRMSLVVTFVNMASVPYSAMFSAKQRLVEVSFWGLAHNVFNFSCAYALTKIRGDKLLYFAGFQMVGNLFFQGILIVRARFLFPESKCRIKRWWDKARFTELLSFVTWNFFGSFGGLIRSQGSAVLVNLFFGPKVNAAYGIGNTVSSQTAALTTSLMSSLGPEISASEGRGDRERVKRLALSACQLGTLLVMFFSIPLFIEMEFVLKIWLKEPPLYALLFCRMSLAIFVMDSLSYGLMLAINATGRIAAYQVVLGILNVLTLPLAWLLIKSNLHPSSVVIAITIIAGCSSFGRVLFARKILQIPIRGWLLQVFLPIVLSASAGAIVAFLPSLLMKPSLLRLFLSTACCFLILAALGWLLILRRHSTNPIVEKIYQLLPFLRRKAKSEA